MALVSPDTAVTPEQLAQRQVMKQVAMDIKKAALKIFRERELEPEAGESFVFHFLGGSPINSELIEFSEKGYKAAPTETEAGILRVNLYKLDDEDLKRKSGARNAESEVIHLMAAELGFIRKGSEINLNNFYVKHVGSSFVIHHPDKPLEMQIPFAATLKSGKPQFGGFSIRYSP